MLRSASLVIARRRADGIRSIGGPLRNSGFDRDGSCRRAPRWPQTVQRSAFLNRSLGTSLPKCAIVGFSGMAARWRHPRSGQEAQTQEAPVSSCAIVGTRPAGKWCRFFAIVESQHACPGSQAVASAAISPHFAHYNFVRLHRSLRVTPDMTAGVSDKVLTLEELVEQISR